MMAALALLASAPVSCNPDNGESGEGKKETVDLSKLDPVSLNKVITGDNWVFSGKPQLSAKLKNPNSVELEVEVGLTIKTDIEKAVVYQDSKQVKLVPNEPVIVDLTTKDNLDPGFYTAYISVDKPRAKMISFTFGVDPTSIVSAPFDYISKEDFESFWKAAKDQLEAIDNMVVSKRKIDGKSSDASNGRTVYMVELNSIPNGTSGAPEVVRGYYCEPNDGQKHPVIMHFFGYDSQPSFMHAPSGGSSNYAEFYMSCRGQMLNNRTASNRDDGIAEDYTNTYGDWFAYNFGQRDAYYYRGAFMDCVQAVRFMAAQPTSDTDRFYAEGSSQGGAFTYAAASLSDLQFAAIVPNVAFLGDFPHYFKIVTWPAETAKKNQGSMTDEQMYQFLSYFDTKNLATRISCPVLATIGMQDKTCPPHTNIAPYNNLKSTDKQVRFYAEMGHDYPQDWDTILSSFITSHPSASQAQ